MDDIKLNKTDIEKGIRNEERNEAMNMMNSAQKSNSKLFDKGYDSIQWDGKPKPKSVPALQWYGYMHVEGSIHCKRYFSEVSQGDIDEAIESDFVWIVHGPFEAENREAALKILREVFNGYGR
jgi:hypothetical protein